MGRGNRFKNGTHLDDLEQPHRVGALHAAAVLGAGDVEALDVPDAVLGGAAEVAVQQVAVLGPLGHGAQSRLLLRRVDLGAALVLCVYALLPGNFGVFGDRLGYYWVKSKRANTRNPDISFTHHRCQTQARGPHHR